MTAFPIQPVPLGWYARVVERLSPEAAAFLLANLAQATGRVLRLTGPAFSLHPARTGRLGEERDADD